MTWTFPWTEQNVETLKALWAEGISCSQIGKVLGNGITRNAVIGKVTRLKLPKRITTPVIRKPRKTTNSTKRLSFTSLFAPEPMEEIEYVPEIDESAIPIEQRRTILTVKDRECRWPVGDPATPEFFLCGGQTVDGRPYCAAHCRRAYHKHQASQGTVPAERKELLPAQKVAA